jgi:hypothetical protein
MAREWALFQIEQSSGAVLTQIAGELAATLRRLLESATCRVESPSFVAWPPHVLANVDESSRDREELT